MCDGLTVFCQFSSSISDEAIVCDEIIAAETVGSDRIIRLPV